MDGVQLWGYAMSNLRFWNVLGKTDPVHTKGFQRAGGFKGTAIKPMWSFLRMTETFGPCGIGWGPERPTFETRDAGEEMLVFCTVGLWYIDPSDKSRGLVFGVGGDKYFIKQKDGLRSSDEAFKAAYTDALSNAMKLIGVAADVHMGMFDDNKYVNAMQDEFHPKPKPVAVVPLSHDDGTMVCLPVDIQQRTNKQKAAFLAVKLNGQIEGKNMAFVWKASLFDAVKSSLKKQSQFNVEMAGDYLNIIDVVSIDGQEYRQGVPYDHIPTDVLEMFEETAP